VEIDYFIARYGFRRLGQVVLRLSQRHVHYKIFVVILLENAWKITVLQLAGLLKYLFGYQMMLTYLPAILALKLSIYKSGLSRLEIDPDLQELLGGNGVTAFAPDEYLYIQHHRSYLLGVPFSPVGTDRSILYLPTSSF